MPRTPVLVLVLVCVGLPLVQAWRLWRLREPTRRAWLLVVADATVFVAVLTLVGRWDIAGYWTRAVLLGVSRSKAAASSSGRAATSSCSTNMPVIERKPMRPISLP